MRLKFYKNSNSLGNSYVFGLNVYKDSSRRFTIDLILGKRVFALINDKVGK
jgi:hypothetical protein